jgi:hypothetical protein
LASPAKGLSPFTNISRLLTKKKAPVITLQAGKNSRTTS